MFSKGQRLPELSGLPDSRVLAYVIIELVYLVQVRRVTDSFIPRTAVTFGDIVARTFLAVFVHTSIDVFPQNMGTNSMLLSIG